MADRSIVVRLQAVVSGFKDQMAQAGRSATELADKVEKSQASLDKVGGTATKAGLVIGAGLGLAAKAAIDWESAWAGVTKTVDGSAAELSTLEGQLRDMAKTLPASHSEIAAVAEAAGQLGVKTKDVASFTKVMIDLGETTNLTADEAATSLAQLMNVMGTAPSDVGRLGAAIVDLGNKGASTERDIVQMGQRIAAAGKSVGMSETDVLGFASALASVGVEAEAGGTAISQTFKQIDKAVRQGDTSLTLIAKTAGMSGEAFTKAWKEDAAGATEAFVAGLGQMQASGQDANGVLEQLGMTGMRQTDSIMRLAQAGDLLSENLQNSSTAWEQNTALVAEAAKRYETTESKIKIAWNNIKDSAITAGGAMLPIVSDMATKASGAADAFGKLPEPMQRMAVGAGVVAAGGLLAVGGLSKMMTTGLELRSSLKELADLSPKTAAGLKTVGKVAGVVAGAMTAAAIANAVAGDSWKKGQTGADDLANSMAKAQSVAINLDSAFQFEEGALIKSKFDGVGDALRRALDPTPVEGFGDVMNGLVGSVNTADRMRSQFTELDKALTSLASGGMGDQAARQFATVAKAASDAGIGADRLVTLFPQYKAQLETVATSLGVVGLSSQDYADWMGGKVPDAIAKAAAASTESNPALEALGGSLAKAGDQAEESKKQLEALADQMKALRDEALQGWSSQIDVEEAIQGARDYAAELVKTADGQKKLASGINDTSKAGRENKQQLMGIAEAAKNVTGTTEEVNAKQARAYEAFLKTAAAMKIGKADADNLWAAMTVIPGEVSTKVHTPGVEDATSRTDAFSAALSKLPAEKQTEILTILDNQGFVAAEAYLLKLNGQKIGLSADPAAATAELTNLQTLINSSTGTVTINGNKLPASDIVSTLLANIDASTGTVTINGQSVPAQDALAVVVGLVNAGQGTIAIGGDNSTAKRATDGAVTYANGSTGTITVSASTASATAQIASWVARMEAISNVNIPVGVSRYGFASGGILRFADGGFPRDVGSIGSRSPGIYGYAGPAGVIMNEAGSGPWEAIVSGNPAKRGRSRTITQDVARRLGGEVTWMADGGVLQYHPGGGAPADVARAIVAALAQQSPERLTADAIGQSVAAKIGTLPVKITGLGDAVADVFVGEVVAGYQGG